MNINQPCPTLLSLMTCFGTAEKSYDQDESLLDCSITTFNERSHQNVIEE
jgi:hypothetical protein